MRLRGSKAEEGQAHFYEFYFERRSLLEKLVLSYGVGKKGYYRARYELIFSNLGA